MNLWGITGLLVLTGVVIAALVVAGPASREDRTIPVYHYEVVHTYPHDRFAFTEGLAYADGVLIEGTGLRGNSSLRRVNLTTGEIMQERPLEDEYFGEGVTVFGDRTLELTKDSGRGFIFNTATFAPAGNFTYSTKGWGITGDGTSLIMSDGTPVLRFLDPVTFREVRQVRVLDKGVPVKNLNELEYVNGEVWANIWLTDRIARISPRTGNVTGWIDLTGLLPPEDRARTGLSANASHQGVLSRMSEKEACLNGIAYDAEGDRIFVTGKLWPDLFEIRVVR
jgi:glutaminyl-peptide cyclotransferase